jgi:hypothetical protein
MNSPDKHPTIVVVNGQEYPLNGSFTIPEDKMYVEPSDKDALLEYSKLTMPILRFAVYDTVPPLIPSKPWQTGDWRQRQARRPKRRRR